MAKRHIQKENRERITKLTKKKLGNISIQHTYTHILKVKVTQLHTNTQQTLILENNKTMRKDNENIVVDDTVKIHATKTTTTHKYTDNL